MHHPPVVGRLYGAGQDLHQLRGALGRQRGAVEFVRQTAAVAELE
jgi:hypothetical protein